uniref:Putative Wall-associated kinase 2 n=1 Tax=Davidia involucrata TaxID=16924 RepID=A0A5B6YX95_DAVIN
MSLHKLVLLLLLLEVMLAAIASRSATAQTKPGCPERCGNLSIPYPFGTREGCYLNDNFLITCSNVSNKPFLRRGNLPVLKISLDGELVVSNWVGYACYNESGGLVNKSDPWIRSSNRFRISYTRNKFTVVGCDTYGLITGSAGYAASCTALCDTRDDLVNGSCSGIGCCQTPIPKSVTDYNLSMISFSNHTRVWNFNPCDLAFVVEEKSYNFSSVDLLGLTTNAKFPLVFDWAIGNEKCGNVSNSVCGEHSTCYNSNNDLGYLCNCSAGYQGNPYLGCQDINECLNATLNQCSNICHNTDGNYTCSCPNGYHGDGRKDEQGCTLALWIKVSAGTGIAILVIGCSLLYWRIKRRKLSKRKKKFYKQNGGEKLEIELSRQNGSIEAVKIYTIKELKKATNDFDASMILGRGGFGTVYKGVLPQNKLVAIKKSIAVDQSKIDQFVNEVITLSQINHRNVVRLLGCCLQTEVPLLVYEFISNGTLFHHLHEVDHESSIPWKIRLRIAKETAGALSYLHSSASTTIIHRDVKSTNILLDDNFTAKVSDFGASRMDPLDKTQLTTIIQGTLGYLDPEYYHTSQLSKKSDVYSFGVLLAELLTAREALYLDRPEEERCLAAYFISSMKENKLFEILDPQIVNEGNHEQLRKVANLVQSCLRLKGEERPTMREVAIELEGQVQVEKHHSVGLEVSSDETEHHLSESMDLGSTSTTAVYDSLKNQDIIPLGDGR